MLLAEVSPYKIDYFKLVIIYNGAEVMAVGIFFFQEGDSASSVARILGRAGVINMNLSAFVFVLAVADAACLAQLLNNCCVQ